MYDCLSIIHVLLSEKYWNRNTFIHITENVVWSYNTIYKTHLWYQLWIYKFTEKNMSV